MVCGRPPFQGGFGDLMLLHMTADPPPPSRHRPDVPASLERTILRALAKEPADRFADMDDFAAALSAVVDAPRLPSSLRRRGGSGRGVPGAAVAALAMVAIIVGATVVGLRRPADAATTGLALRAAAVSLPPAR